MAGGLSLALLLAACAGGTNEPSNDGELTTVTVVTNWLPSSQHAPLYVALDKGIFESHGLDVRVEPGKGSLDAALKVSAGAAQFALIDSTASLVAVGQDAEVVNVTAFMKKYPGGMCFNKDRVQLESLEDIDGAVLGTVENDAFTLGLKSLMTREGIDPQERLKEEIIDAASQQSALLAGRIDMIPCSTQSKLAAIRGGEEAGVDIGFFSLAEHGLDAVGSSVVVAKSLLDEDEEVVRSFVAAFVEATELIIEDPEMAVSALKAAVPDVDTDTELAVLTEEVIPLIGAAGERFVFTDAEIDATIRNARDSFGTELAEPHSWFTNDFIDVG